MSDRDWEELVERLVGEIVRSCDAREGLVVSGSERPPYRRLDCDHRALAYIRARPRKRMVRIDLSGTWRLAHSPLAQPSPAGAIVLVVRGAADVAEVVRYFRDTIDGTRVAVRRARRFG